MLEGVSSVNINRTDASGNGNALPSYVAEFADEFQRLIKGKEESGKSGKEFLRTLSSSELYAIQKSKLLVSQIRPETLSEEGAENLFVKLGDDRKYVDLNNDGITEIGVGKMFVFPPPNTSDKVKDAWAKTSQNMSFSDKMLVMGSFLAQRLVEDHNRNNSGEISGDCARSDSEFLRLVQVVKNRMIENSKLETEPAFKKNHEKVIAALDEFEKNILEAA